MPHSRHHLTPQCRYKQNYRPVINSPQNILILSQAKHQAWHSLFKEMTLEEIIAALTRVSRMKARVLLP